MTIVRRGLVEQVAQALQDRISLREWVAGQKLPTETELMALFGVGRSTVREAVRVLVHAGVLSVRQGDGTYVRPVEPQAETLDRRLRRAAILEVYEVRKALELEAARLAAERRDETDLAALADALRHRAAARKTGDTERFLDADIAFHEAIAVAGKNAVLTDIYRAFSGALRDAIAAELHDVALGGQDTTPDHHRLLRAIEKRDQRAAVRAATAVLDFTTKRLRALIEPETE
jgi:DNA-binding FadR family transcriptional regulator